MPKPGGGIISKNTLSLRFMQNAARALQEEEVEAAQAKIRTEEEWELPKELWGGTEHSQEEQTVTYEPSYLPFLFPGLGSNGGQDTSDFEVLVREEGLTGRYRGRRKFAKQIEEEMTKEDDEEDESKPRPKASAAAERILKALPRGARSISSHGRSAGSSSKPASNPAGFMKPSVDSPKPLKRLATDTGAGKKKRKVKEQAT
ncbi:hypothetical protein M422DRAFT_40595 [Sphaerobolus stellatus SS14]|nr:hypothetical protein M422DRAFT_40595 [Sphaerobolus stellatus SS14]